MGPTRATTDDKSHYSHYDNNNNNNNNIMENQNEIEAAMGTATTTTTRKFGDEQSNLLDQFERLSFEIQLSKAMHLGRSLSEPGAMVLISPKPPLLPADPPPLLSQVRQGRRRRPTGLKKVLKKLLRVPVIFGRRRKKEVPDPKDPRFWKTFSRSLRL